MAQGQFYKAFAVPQGHCVLARHGTQRLSCSSHYDDDSIATPILGKQVVYGVSVDRADAWGEGTTIRIAHGCIPYPNIQSRMNKNFYR